MTSDLEKARAAVEELAGQIEADKARLEAVRSEIKGLESEQNVLFGKVHYDPATYKPELDKIKGQIRDLKREVAQIDRRLPGGEARLEELREEARQIEISVETDRADRSRVDCMRAVLERLDLEDELEAARDRERQIRTDIREAVRVVSDLGGGAVDGAPDLLGDRQAVRNRLRYRLEQLGETG